MPGHFKILQIEKEVSYKTPTIPWSHLCEMFSQSIERNWSPGAGGGQAGEWLLKATGDFWGGDENVVTWVFGDGYTILNILKTTTKTFALCVWKHLSQSMW